MGQTMDQMKLLNQLRKAQKELKNEITGAVHYLDNRVKLFDKVALEAVENYQKTVAIEEKTEKIDSTVTNNSENISKSAEKVQKAEEVTLAKEDIAENATTTTNSEKKIISLTRVEISAFSSKRTPLITSSIFACSIKGSSP